MCPDTLCQLVTLVPLALLAHGYTATPTTGRETMLPDATQGGILHCYTYLQGGELHCTAHGADIVDGGEEAVEAVVKRNVLLKA